MSIILNSIAKNAAKYFTVDESGRYDLQNLCIAHKDGKKVAIATDGKMLVKFDVQDDGEQLPEKDVLVNRNMILESFKRVKKRTPDTVTLDADEQSATISYTSIICNEVIVQEGIGGKFPEWEGVFPKDSPKDTVSFDPARLAQVCAFAKSISPKAVIFETHGEGNAMKFIITLEDGGHVEGLLMPCRVE